MGYFRREFVERRRWLSDETFAETIALTQMLPGPASSQTCFLVGVSVAGLLGGIIAWVGFTLPSACLMTLLAAGISREHGALVDRGLHGLQVAAVAVVAAAVVTMFQRLCPDWPRRWIAAAAAAVAIALGASATQMLVIVGGAIAGVFSIRFPADSLAPAPSLPVSKRAGIAALALFAALFFILAATGPKFEYAMYRTGALVFGGGHVVLPLLEQAVVRPGWVDPSDFLAGYGAAQAIPGPLFTFGSFLGFVSRLKPNGVTGSASATIAIFLPGLLLAYGIAPFWSWVRGRPGARPALAGVNASVVGLLTAALVAAGRTVLRSPSDIALAAVAFAMLLTTRISPVIVVVAAAALLMVFH